MRVPDPIRLTRQELYDKVWATPMSKLAKEYHLSDVGLAKICTRHQIPRPGIGYWARLATGKKDPKTPLPTIPPGDLDPIEIVAEDNAATRIFANDFEDARTELDRAQKMSSSTPVSLRSSLEHPTLIRLQQLRKKPRKGFPEQPKENEHLPYLNVSEVQWDRAARILDSVFLEAKRRGYEIRIDENSATYFRVLGEDVQVYLKETLKRVDVPPADNPRDRLFQNKYDFIPTGILTLSIENLYVGWNSGRRNWHDRAEKKLEEQIGDFFEGLVEAAAKMRAWSQKLEEMDRKRNEAERRYQEEQEVKRREQAQRNQLVTDAENWTKSQLIRSFIEAKRKADIEKKSDISPMSDFGKWSEWAKNVADELDPLVHCTQAGEKEGDRT